jgi:hypothetical protein
MQDTTHALFNNKTIEKLCSNITIDSKQKNSAKKWLNLIESGSLNKEKENYFRFADIILQDVLGYSVREELKFEEDYIEFSFMNPITKKGVCIEVKGTATKDLFSDQHRDKPEHRTPIMQTWSSIGKRSHFDYGIATNYREFVLIDKSKGYSLYHILDFMDIKNNDGKLKEFIAIFSKESIIDKRFIPKLYEESVIEQQEFTKQFYKLYHETRLMLIREFQNNQVTREEAIHYAQLFLNRLIFLFFAEGTGKVKRRLFAESILQSLHPLLVSEYSRYVSDTIINIFERLDKGSQHPIEIFAFNGGLFSEKIPSKVFFNDLRDASFFNQVLQHSTLKKQINLDEYSQMVVDRFRNYLNPLVINLLIMSSFDFQSEVNVNILGNIFEQSVTDLEELQGSEQVSKRKKEGIYYTPQYITDYICRNTIIPFLSKNGLNRVDDLIEEYSDNIEELERRFQDIKIIDPACGSGAFLLKAVDVLLEIHKKIQIHKESTGKYTVVRKSKKYGIPERYITLTKWHEQEEARNIIENNIFGVDVNEESVEITKLSLFLKIATNNRKLLDLTQNIKVGNSLIDDMSVAGDKAFVWRDVFTKTFDNGGFDIVIGNPPYLRIQGLHESHENTTKYLEQKYESATGRYDFYVLFIEKGATLIKKNGFLGFIIPHKFTNSQFGRGIRKYLSEKKLIHKLLSFGYNFIFEGVTTYNGIIILKNTENTKLLYKEIIKLKTSSIEDDLSTLTNEDYISIDNSSLNDNPWVLNQDPILNKITKSGPSISEYFDKILQGVIAGG